MEFATAAEAFVERDRILRGVLQPAAIDIVNWPSGFRLLLNAGGNAKVLDRYARELPGARVSDESVWTEVREFTPRFLTANPQGGVVAISTSLADMPAAVAKLDVPFIARAGSGVIYAHYAQRPPDVDLPASSLEMMVKLKDMFDPWRLLNRGRLYGRI